MRVDPAVPAASKVGGLMATRRKRRRKRQPNRYASVDRRAVRELRPAALTVLLAITLWAPLRRGESPQGEVIASYAEVAEAAGLSESHVRRQVRALEGRRYWVSRLAGGVEVASEFAR